MTEGAGGDQVEKGRLSRGREAAFASLGGRGASSVRSYLANSDDPVQLGESRIKGGKKSGLNLQMASPLKHAGSLALKFAQKVAILPSAGTDRHPNVALLQHHGRKQRELGRFLFRCLTESLKNNAEHFASFRFGEKQ